MKIGKLDQKTCFNNARLQLLPINVIWNSKFHNVYIGYFIARDIRIVGYVSYPKMHLHANFSSKQTNTPPVNPTMRLERMFSLHSPDF